MVDGRGRRWCVLDCEKNVFLSEIVLFLREPQKPTPSQPRRPSCSSGTQCEWRRTREQTPQAWRRGSNVTRKTTQETVGTLTFQRDTWVVDTFLWTAYSLQMFPIINTKFSTVLIWYYKYTWVINWHLSNLCVATVWLVEDRCWWSLVLLCCGVFQMDLMPFVNKAGCECLNESDDCGFDNCLNKESSYLESDCDEQVIANTNT